MMPRARRLGPCATPLAGPPQKPPPTRWSYRGRSPPFGTTPASKTEPPRRRFLPAPFLAPHPRRHLPARTRKAPHGLAPMRNDVQPFQASTEATRSLISGSSERRCGPPPPSPPQRHGAPRVPSPTPAKSRVSRDAEVANRTSRPAIASAMPVTSRRNPNRTAGQAVSPFRTPSTTPPPRPPVLQNCADASCSVDPNAFRHARTSCTVDPNGFERLRTSCGVDPKRLRRVCTSCRVDPRLGILFENTVRTGFGRLDPPDTA